METGISNFYEDLGYPIFQLEFRVSITNPQDYEKFV